MVKPEVSGVQVPVKVVQVFFPSGGVSGRLGEVQLGREPSSQELSPHCGRLVMEPEVSSRNMTLEGPVGSLKKASSPATGPATVEASEVVTLQQVAWSAWSASGSAARAMTASRRVRWRMWLST